jgi:hypothetical protein
MYQHELKERLAFIERALKSNNFTLPERRDLMWEAECCKREIENQSDREYLERIAKMKADAYQDEINDRLDK